MPMASKVHSTSARQAIVPRQRILLCYDGSAEARRALERVGETASVVPSRVTVVSVADPVYPDPPYTGYADPGEEQTHRRLLDRGDARGVARKMTGLPWQRRGSRVAHRSCCKAILDRGGRDECELDDIV
jgi:hypothetical protein